jgi:hypothetical protein
VLVGAWVGVPLRRARAARQLPTAVVRRTARRWWIRRLCRHLVAAARRLARHRRGSRRHRHGHSCAWATTCGASLPGHAPPAGPPRPVALARVAENRAPLPSDPASSSPGDRGPRREPAWLTWPASDGLRDRTGGPWACWTARWPSRREAVGSGARTPGAAAGPVVVNDLGTTAARVPHDPARAQKSSRPRRGVQRRQRATWKGAGPRRPGGRQFGRPTSGQQCRILRRDELQSRRTSGTRDRGAPQGHLATCHPPPAQRGAAGGRDVSGGSSTPQRIGPVRPGQPINATAKTGHRRDDMVLTARWYGVPPMSVRPARMTETVAGGRLMSGPVGPEASHRSSRSSRATRPPCPGQVFACGVRSPDAGLHLAPPRPRRGPLDTAELAAQEELLRTAAARSPDGLRPMAARA